MVNTDKRALLELFLKQKTKKSCNKMNKIKSKSEGELSGNDWRNFMIKATSPLQEQTKKQKRGRT